MKHLYLFFFLSVLSCGGQDTSLTTHNVKVAPVTDFDWLLGNWKRVNEKGEKLTYESWEKTGTSTYQGIGYTMLRADTVWQEEMRLVKTDEGWNFEAISNGDPAPTIFKITDIGKETFTSQNPENDFPNQIIYFKSGEFLKAIVSGEGMEIAFDFERIK